MIKVEMIKVKMIGVGGPVPANPHLPTGAHPLIKVT